jgi:hypothetical protein
MKTRILFLTIVVVLFSPLTTKSYAYTWPISNDITSWRTDTITSMAFLAL